VSRYLFLAVGLTLCLPTLLHAQLPAQQYNPYRSQTGRQQQATMQPLEVSGTIRMVARTGIALTNNMNQTWRVAILPVTKVQVTGPATRDCLRSGLAVEFTADIDSHGAIQGKVDSLTVITLTKDKQMGLSSPDADSGFGEPAADDSGKPAKRTTRTSAKTAKTAKTAKAAPHAQAAGNYRIIGQLVVGRGGALSVKPGRTMLPFELAEQPKINLDVADLTLARPGQEISVKGYVSPRQPGTIQAAEVKIKLPEAEGSEKVEKKEPPKVEAKKAAKRPNKDQGEGLPEPDPKP
jgi:hypothetical protein